MEDANSDRIMQIEGNTRTVLLHNIPHRIPYETTTTPTQNLGQCHRYTPSERLYNTYLIALLELRGGTL